MSIKDVVYRVVHAYPGGVPALAARMGISKHVLQNKVNPNNDTHHLTINELVQIQEFTNSDEIAKYLASERNMVCIPIIYEHQSASDMEILDLIFDTGIRNGEWLSEIKGALSDGNIDLNENKRIRERYLTYQAALAEAMARLDSLAH